MMGKKNIQEARGYSNCERRYEGMLWMLTTWNQVLSEHRNSGIPFCKIFGAVTELFSELLTASRVLVVLTSVPERDR